LPPHRSHNYVDKLLFGRSYPRVHKAIDQPCFVLGRKHRRLFHTPEDAYIMGSLASSDQWGGLVGLTHIWLDKKCSEDKEFKKVIDFMAKQDALSEKKRRRMRKLLEKLRK